MIKKTVENMWKPTVDELSAPARAVLAISGWLGPNEIPRMLFAENERIIEKLARELPPASLRRNGKKNGFIQPYEASPAAVDHALAELANMSLIKLEPEAVTCHRMLQLVQRLRAADSWLAEVMMVVKG